MSSKARPRSPLAMVVLAILVEGPMHAYGIQQLIRVRGKDAVVNVARSNSIYQTLDRLLRDELIRVRSTDKAVAASAGPSRIVYEVTPAGRKTWREWILGMLSTPAREFPEFPAALATVALLTPLAVREELERRVSALDERVVSMQARSAQAKKMELPRVLLLEDEYDLHMVRAELRWLRKTIEELDSGALEWSEKQLAKFAGTFGQPTL